MDALDDGTYGPGKQAIIIGTGSKAYDLMRCNFYLQGLDDVGLSQYIKSSEPGFALKPGTNKTEITVRLQFTVKTDISVVGIIVSRGSRIVERLQCAIDGVRFEKDDVLNVRYDWTVTDQVTIRK